MRWQENFCGWTTSTFQPFATRNWHVPETSGMLLRHVLCCHETIEIHSNSRKRNNTWNMILFSINQPIKPVFCLMGQIWSKFRLFFYILYHISWCVRFTHCCSESQVTPISPLASCRRYHGQGYTIRITAERLRYCWLMATSIQHQLRLGVVSSSFVIQSLR